MDTVNTTSASGAIVTESSSHGVSVVDDAFYYIRLVFGILGLAGNGLVLVVMIRVPSLRSISNLFITNQSIIDFVSSVFLIVCLYDPGRSDYSELGYTVWSVFLCHVWHSQYIFWAMLGVSTVNLIIITLERYVSIVHPITYRNRGTWKTATVFAVLPWVIGFISESYWPAVHVIVDGVCYPDFRSQTVQSTLGIFIFTLKIFGPVMIMSTVYITIFRRFKSRGQVNPDTIQMDLSQPQLGRVAQRNCGSASVTDAPGSSTATSVLDTARSLNVTGTSNGSLAVPSGPGGNTLSVRHAFPAQNSLRSRVRLNILKTMFIVTVVFTICWTPTATFYLLYNLGYPFDVPNGTPHKALAAVVFVNIWINPVIYTFKYRRFQDGLRKTFNCFNFPRRQEPS